MSGSNGLSRWVTCPCGKRSYYSKADAKRARRRIGEHMAVYRCDDSGEWHLGHLPPAVRRGEVGRAVLRRREP